MGVYIKGLNKREAENILRMCSYDNEVIEVAEPHGRLLDAERLSEKPNNCEDDEYWKYLFTEVVKGHMSDATANQAWYEYINHKDEQKTDCETCRHNKSGRYEKGSLSCGRCCGTNFEFYEPKTEPTISKMEQVDCVR